MRETRGGGDRQKSTPRVSLAVSRRLISATAFSRRVSSPRFGYVNERVTLTYVSRRGVSGTRSRARRVSDHVFEAQRSAAACTKRAAAAARGGTTLRCT